MPPISRHWVSPTSVRPGSSGTGAPVGQSITPSSGRTAAPLIIAQKLVADGAEPGITAKTGLLLDSYFTATKFAWILDHVEGARACAEAGDLAFGTVDAFLIWRLTGGAVFATDATNASRTLLYDITAGDYDPDLLSLFGLRRDWLPEPRDSSGDFGHIRADLFGGAIPIRGVAGDQQAATVGQACFSPGMVKVTYGTGAFALVNIGQKPVPSKNRFADDGGLSDRRQAQLCPGGRDLRRGSQRAMAA